MGFEWLRTGLRDDAGRRVKLFVSGESARLETGATAESDPARAADEEEVRQKDARYRGWLWVQGILMVAFLVFLAANASTAGGTQGTHNPWWSLWYLFVGLGFLLYTWWDLRRPRVHDMSLWSKERLVWHRKKIGRCASCFADMSRAVPDAKSGRLLCPSCSAQWTMTCIPRCRQCGVALGSTLREASAASRCPSCQTPTARGLKQCAKCDYPLDESFATPDGQLKCPECGTIARAGVQFDPVEAGVDAGGAFRCSGCGRSLASGVQIIAEVVTCTSCSERFVCSSGWGRRYEPGRQRRCPKCSAACGGADEILVIRSCLSCRTQNTVGRFADSEALEATGLVSRSEVTKSNEP